MALNTQLSELAVNAQGDALSALLDGGSLRIYSGFQPRSADDDVPEGAALLVELMFASPAAGPAERGEIAFEGFSDGLAKASGRATWFRAVSADGAAVIDGSVGTQNANLIVTQAYIEAGKTVRVSRLSHVIAPASPGH